MSPPEPFPLKTGWLARLLAGAGSVLWFTRARFDCPLCGYRGPFRNKISRRYQLRRRHAKCLRCGANERTRFQYLVCQRLGILNSLPELDVLHVAPEPELETILRHRARCYLSADLERDDVDCRLDVQAMPFPDARFDLVLASHVLMYVPDDRMAIREIRRVLRPGGIAMLPVPILSEQTHEEDDGRFRRQPGLDYPERYRQVFDRVERYYSGDFDSRFQVSFHEQALGGHASGVVAHAQSMRLGPDQYQDLMPVAFVD